MKRNFKNSGSEKCNNWDKKRTLDRFNNKFEMAEERFSELEGGSIESFQSKQRQEIVKKNIKSLRDLWSILSGQIIGLPEWKDRMGQKCIWNYNGQNSPKFVGKKLIYRSKKLNSVTPKEYTNKNKQASKK